MDLYYRNSSVDSGHNKVEATEAKEPLFNFHFNPVTYFPCKLCRNAFPTVDTLLKHKRLQHTISELKDIKCIIFEARFIQQDVILEDLLKSHEISRNEVEVINHYAKPESVVECSNKNPYVLVRRLTEKEIQVAKENSKKSDTRKRCGKEQYNEQDLVDEEFQVEQQHCLKYSKRVKRIEKELVSTESELEAEIESKSTDADDTNLPLTSEQRLILVEETDNSCSSPVQSNSASVTEFIVLDITSNPSGHREIAFSTSTEVIVMTDADANKIQENQPELNIKHERGPELEQLDSEESEKDVDDVEHDMKSSPESKVRHKTRPLLEYIPRAEPVDFPKYIQTIEIEALPKRYNTRRSTRSNKNYIEAEEFKCRKCAEFFFSQNEFKEHIKLHYKEPVSKIESESEISVKLVEDTDQEWSEHSEAEDDNDDEKESRNIGFKESITESGTKSKNDDKNVSYVKRKTTSPKTGSKTEVSSTLVNESEGGSSTTSLKDWLKTYKKDISESIVLLDPDPLREPDQGQGQSQGQDESAAGAGTETVLFPLRCKLCNKKLKNDHLTKEHVMMCWRHKKSHRYCFNCDKTFRFKSHLKKHNEAKHREPDQDDLRPKIQCPTCKKEVLGGKAQLKLHMATHENREKNFVCEICASSFFRLWSLNEHMKTHSNDRPYKCTQCSLTFKSNKDVWNHSSRKHSTIRYPCTLCGKTFRSNQTAQNHMRVRHTGEKPFTCPHSLVIGGAKCPQTFSTKDTLQFHCRKEHPEALTTSQIPCTLCSKTFWNNSTLQIHMIKHNRVRPHKCTHEGCTKSFLYKHGLKDHLRAHTGEKPFQCDGCGATFWKPSSFRKHCTVSCRSKVCEEERNKFLCHLCPRKFPGKWELKLHFKLHEKGNLNTECEVKVRRKGVGSKGKVKGTEYECKVCDFKCGTKKGLREHEKIHDDSEEEDERETESGDESLA